MRVFEHVLGQDSVQERYALNFRGTVTHHTIHEILWLRELAKAGKWATLRAYRAAIVQWRHVWQAPGLDLNPVAIIANIDELLAQANTGTPHVLGARGRRALSSEALLCGAAPTFQQQ